MVTNMKNFQLFFRSGLFFLLFVVNIILFATIILLTIPFTSLKQRRKIACYWSYTNRRLLAVICGLKDRFVGLENLPPPPFVLLCKHQSAWETVSLHAIFPLYVLVLKKSLLYIPFFGWALKATGQIDIDRSREIEALRTLQTKGKKTLEQGTCIMLFPEGTRVTPGTTGRFNAGGVSLALESGVPIVPVAHNAGEFWGKHAFLKKPGVIQIKIGQAIPTVGLKKGARKDLTNQVRLAIESMMADIDGQR